MPRSRDPNSSLVSWVLLILTAREAKKMGVVDKKSVLGKPVIKEGWVHGRFAISNVCAIKMPDMCVIVNHCCVGRADMLTYALPKLCWLKGTHVDGRDADSHVPAACACTPFNVSMIDT